MWADFWQLYWARGGPSGVTILKVDAHHVVEDVILGRIGALEFLGNAYADGAAKIAARQIQVSEDHVNSVNFADARTWLVQKRMLVAYKDKLELDKTCHERITRNKPNTGKHVPQTRQELIEIIKTYEHKIHWDGKWYRCERCLKAVGASGLYRWAAGCEICRDSCGQACAPAPGGGELVHARAGEGDQGRPGTPPPPPRTSMHERASQDRGENANQTPTPESNRSVHDMFVCDQTAQAPPIMYTDGYIGTSKRRIHESHNLREKGGIIWCARCGKTVTVRALGLTKECEKPTKEGAKVLSRIKDGETPTDKAPWPNPDREVIHRVILRFTEQPSDSDREQLLP